jgi:hypothetical protein
MRRATLSHLLIRMSNRAGELYPAPTASQVPALAANTTVVMKITASIRDKVHALGIGMASVTTRDPLWKNLCISCG